MGEIGRWNRHRFIVSSDVIRSFDNLNITGGSETEDKENNKEKYVSYKNAKPTQITIDVHLSAQLGCNVREEAMGMIDDAQKGISDYFYIGKEKLVTYKLMLTDASVSEVGITHTCYWSQATVRLTFKQSTKCNGSIASGSGGSGGSGGATMATKDNIELKTYDWTDKVKALTYADDNAKDKGTSQGMTPIDVYPVINTVLTNYYGTDEEKKAQQARQTAANIVSMAKATTARSNSTDVKSTVTTTKVTKINKIK